MPALPIERVEPAADRVEQPVFYYDLGDPACYLVAEQIMSALPVVPEWEPVLLGAPAARDLGRFEVKAHELGIQPMRWPEPWPPDSRWAMLAATYAKRIGRAVAFSLAAYRQAFAGGRDLGDENTILIAGAACEIHPTALLKGMAMRAVSDGLEAATQRARTAGVHELPAIQVGEAVFSDLAGAAEALR
jgi:2-hydroxychromene-2-carboxylate isomerase